MALTIREVSDPSVWEDFVQTHSPESLFQSWTWGDIQKDLGVQVTRNGVYRDSILVGVAQTTHIKARRGPFLHIRHGPIFSEADTRLWQAFIPHMKQIARENGAWFVRMNPLLDDNQMSRTQFKQLGLIPAAIHRMDGEYCWVLPLTSSPDELLAGMRKSTRYEIRKAQKEGATITRRTGVEAITEFLSLYKKTAERQHFVPHKGIEEEFRVFAKDKNAIVYLGIYKGVVSTGALILYYGNQAIYHHGASIHAEIPLSSFVQWEAIQDAKKRGVKVYNFWGIAPDNVPNHPWRGITLFKKGFGGHEISYIHAHDLPIQPWYVLPRAIEEIRRIRKGYD